MGWDASAWQPQILASWATCENSCCNRDKFGEEFWNCADIAILPGGSTVSTSTMSTTSTVETSSTTATTTIITDEFRPVDGGVGRACRGAHAGDNLATYFTVLNGISSLEECKEKCLQSSAPSCVGIEYSRGRCEVWTRPAGIGASIPLTGFTCLRYGAEPTTTTSPTVPGSFEPVDGGENRVCRGANPNDNKPEYYTVLQGIGTLQLCKAQCASTEGCVGIEFKGSRCEVWTRPQGIEASRSLSGFWCLRYTAPSTTTSREGLICSQAWGACGGRNWDGPNCCEEGYSCLPESEWYSQCRPAENTAALMEMPGLKPRTWKRFRGTTMLQDGSLLSRTKGTSKDEL